MTPLLSRFDLHQKKKMFVVGNLALGERPTYLPSVLVGYFCRALGHTASFQRAFSGFAHHFF